MMDEIERLELRIEELREAIERSRRLRLAGRASAVAGPALLAGFALGLVAYTPTRMIVALALAIGGVVLMGSSRSSTEELERALRQAEAERIAAIDALELVQVGEGKDSDTLWGEGGPLTGADLVSDQAVVIAALRLGRKAKPSPQKPTSIRTHEANSGMPGSMAGAP